MPLRGKIEPGITEKVEFSYYALPYNRFNLKAVCKVQGGPDYLVDIKAEASDVAYKIKMPKNQNSLNIGNLYVNQKVVKEFELINTSKVIFEYNIRLDTSGENSHFMKDFIKIVPSKGNLEGGESIKIKLFITPALPNKFEENVIV